MPKEVREGDDDMDVVASAAALLVPPALVVVAALLLATEEDAILLLLLPSFGHLAALPRANVDDKDEDREAGIAAAAGPGEAE